MLPESGKIRKDQERSGKIRKDQERSEIENDQSGTSAIERRSFSGHLEFTSGAD